MDFSELFQDYSREIKCGYKGELYSARDDGAVLRLPLPGKRQRPTDNRWTLGKLNEKTGYLEIAAVRVHRIIATAFNGEPPTKEHVVDHIDTNKQNNRPENLRWVTRLENILLNPITAKRIAFICGSVEAFLEDPSKFRDRFQDPNYHWMCAVSVQEAQTSLERLLAWSKSDQVPSGGSLGAWIYNRTTYGSVYEEPIPEVPEIILSKTPNAAQRNWRIASEFPCCPQQYSNEPILTYATNLEIGALFCRNDVYSSQVFKYAVVDSNQALCVITESPGGIKQFAIAKITFENEQFVHTSIRTFFTQEGAEKEFCLSQGLEWTGGDSIDDYC